MALKGKGDQIVALKETDNKANYEKTDNKANHEKGECLL